MRTLYFDCFSGISGDMTIGALLDLGLEFDYLKSELQKLPVEGYQLEARRVVRANISAMKFDVLMNAHEHSEHRPHELHDGHRHDHEQEHRHQSGNPGSQWMEPHARHEQCTGHVHHRASEIIAMIEASTLTPNARRLAAEIFRKLAISEGKVHHVPPEDVEFHEVGAVDSIVDTVGVAIGLDALGIEQCICSAINVGAGFIHCQHGIYPVPAPATADLLRKATIYSKHVQTELVTPTGAAILAAVIDRFESLPQFSIDRIGYGAGTKTFGEFPNCLRLMLGEEGGGGGRSEEVVVLEANIDDMTSQNLRYATDQLLEAGALDVIVVPAQMKKGRPGFLVQILAPANLVEGLSAIVFRETTTIGIRRYTASRSVLDREVVPVSTDFGVVTVKVSRMNGAIVNVAPEYEDCVRVAREKNVPLKEVQEQAIQRFRASI